MKESRDWIVGMDITQDTAQLCCFDRKTGEAVSIPEKAGSTEYEVAAALCLMPDTEEGYIGREAVFFHTQKGGFLVRSLLDLCRKGSKVQIGENQYAPSDLMARFILAMLRLLGTGRKENLKALAITVPLLSDVLVRNLLEACQKAGFSRDQILLMDHPQSFYYYVMTQRKESWNRSVGWYEFREGGEVLFHRLSVQAGQMPVLVQLRQLGEDQMPGPEKARDHAFAAFVRKTLGEELYSMILLTGNGFSQEWAKESIRALCASQRKVYYGNNLFAKGACGGAKELKEDRNLKAYRFLSDTMVLTNVGMEMKVTGAPAYYPLLEAGKNWYEYRAECDFLLDGVKDLVFVVSRAGKSEKRKVAMQLPGLPDRPAKTTRLRLRMEYLSQEECLVTVKDLGFGEMYPSSRKVWTERICWEKEGGLS